MPDDLGAPTIYSRLKGVCKGVLKNYQTDLTVHDRTICRALVPGDMAMYAVRSSGTHFATFRNAEDQTPEAAEKTARKALEYLDAINSVAPNARWYLVECTIPQRGHVARTTFQRARSTIESVRSRATTATRRAA